MLSSAIAQGVGVATGLQSRFDFAGVAASGIGAGLSSAFGGRFGAAGSKAAAFGQRLAVNTAGGLANAATRSVLSGTDFGDNLIAALPDVIGNTIGGYVGDQVAGRSGAMSPGEKALLGEAEKSARTAPQSGIGGGRIVDADEAPDGDIVVAGNRRRIETDAAYAIRMAREDADAARDDRAALLTSDPNLPFRPTSDRRYIRTADLDVDEANYRSVIATQGAASNDDDVLAAFQAERERLSGVASDATAAQVNAIRQALPPLDFALSLGAIGRGRASTGDYVTVGASVLPGAGRIVSKALVGETAIARAVRLGRDGEAAAGITGAKSGIVINGRMRFPDEVTLTTIKEVKNVARQGWTQQLKDYSDLARRDGKIFELIVRPDTKISRILDAAEQFGDVVIKKIGGK